MIQTLHLRACVNRDEPIDVMVFVNEAITEDIQRASCQVLSPNCYKYDYLFLWSCTHMILITKEEVLTRRQDLIGGTNKDYTQSSTNCFVTVTCRPTIPAFLLFHCFTHLNLSLTLWVFFILLTIRVHFSNLLQKARISRREIHDQTHCSTSTQRTAVPMRDLLVWTF